MLPACRRPPAPPPADTSHLFQTEDSLAWDVDELAKRHKLHLRSLDREEVRPIPACVLLLLLLLFLLHYHLQPLFQLLSQMLTTLHIVL